MKTKSTGRVKCAAMLLGGGLLLGTGNCIPEDLWVNTWGRVLTTTTDAVVDVYVIDPLYDALVPADD